jgi:hypothetical protein
VEHRDTADERRRVRDRQVMLNKVRNRWITGVLDQSLANETQIRLGLARRPDTILTPCITVPASTSTGWTPALRTMIIHHQAGRSLRWTVCVQSERLL